MARAQLGGVSIAYDLMGAGSHALLLVHGHPFNRSMWRAQAEAASAAGWRVVVPDLRGYGESDVLDGTVTLDVFAHDLAAVLDHLGIDRVVVGGLSMGGQIAMEFARLYPDRLRGLVLAATFPHAETSDGKTQRRSMAERLLREGMDGYAHEVLPRMLALDADTPDGVAEAVLAMMRSTSPAGAAAALRGRAERPDYEATLAGLRVPALVVVGSRDAFTSRADADRMHALLAGSTLVWLEGSGHMPNLERPSAFNRALLAFLDGVR